MLTTLTQAELNSTIIRNPLMVTPETTVWEAIAQMSGLRTVCAINMTVDQQTETLQIDARSSCILVVENQQVLGILTERDIVRLSTEKLSLDSIPIGEVMISPVITLKESAFTDFLSVINLLQQYKIRHLPLVNDQDQVVGLLTHESLLQVSRPTDLLRFRMVAEVMTNEVIYAVSHTSMIEIARLMATHGISSVVIVQTEERGNESLLIPVGIVTERDLVQFQALNLDLETCQVVSVMSRQILTVSETDSLWNVQEIMEQRSLQRLIVTGQKGQLLGIVTATNILKAINPLELYKLAQVLEQKVSQLEDEKIALLENRNNELERLVEERTAIVKAKAEQERLISTIATQIRSSLNLQEILNTTVQEVRSLLNCDRVVIWQLLPDYTVMVLAEATTSEYVYHLGTEVNDPCFGDWVNSYQQGRSNVVADIYTTEMSDCHRQFLEDLRIRAKILVPILQGKVLWGLLSASESDFPRSWQNEEVNLLQQLATQVAIAIQQATAFQLIENELLERHKIETALIESQNRYINLTANAPVGIFRTDKEGNCVFVNKCWCDITGLTFEEALGNGWIKSLHPDDRARVISQWYATVLECHICLELEYRYQRPDGVITWVLAKAILERQNREIIGYVGTITDITEGKRASEIVKNLIAGTSSVTGREFFPALAQHIINAFQLDRVVITKMRNGVFCKLVDLWHQQDQAHSDQEDLAQLNAQCDLSLTLHNHEGADLGYIALWSKNFTHSSDLGQIINTLQVFAARAEAEIERIETTEELQRRNHQLRQTQSALEQFNLSLENMVKEQTKEVFKVNILQKAILDGADYSIISTDVNGIIQTFNAGAEKMLGYSANEVIGQVTPAIFHDRTEVAKQAEILSQVLNMPVGQGFEVFIALCGEGINHEQEWTYIRQDGSRFPVWLSITALYDSQGTISGFLGIGKDITPRKQAEIQVQKLTDRLALALKSGAIGSWEWDLTSNTIIWDERMYELYGYSKQPEGIVVYDLWANGLHPDDRQATETLLQQAVLGQAVYDTEFRIVHPDGSIHFIKAYGVVSKDAQGNPQSMIGVNFDITENKLTEENLKTERVRLQMALDAANMGTWSFQPTRNKLIWSDRTQEICGFVQGTFPEQRDTFLNMIHPEDLERVLQSVGHTFATGYPYHIEYRIYRLDGIMRWVEVWGLISPNINIGEEEIIGVVADISDRKQVEIQLQKLSDRLALALKSGAIGSWEWDITSTISLWDERMYQLYDLPAQPDQFVDYEVWKNRLHPDDRLPTQRLIDQVILGQAIYDTEFRIVHSDGSIHVIKAYGEAIRNNQGHIERMIGVNFDITERKQIEENLKSERIRLQMALEAANMGAWTYNISTGELNWSDRSQEIFGFVPGTFTGNIASFISMIHPEDRDMITQLIDHSISTASGQSSNLEYRIIRTDGETRWISAWWIIYQNLPNIDIDKEMVGVVTDITDRKLAELERQKLLQELSAFKLGLDEAAIVAITDTKGIMTYVNDRFCAISGYCRDELIGQTHRLVNSGYHPRSFFQDLWRTIVRGQVWRGEICNRTKNGHIYWVDSTIVPFLDRDGRPFQYLAVRFDITARKLAEVAQKRLLQAMDVAVDGIAIVEGDNYIYVNQSHIQLFGYEQPEDLLGKSWRLLYSQAEINRLEQEVFPILGRDGFWQGEAIATCKDGSTFDEELSLTVTDEGLLICVCRDITQRKIAEKALQQSEIRHRQMFNSSVVGMILADFQGRIIEANDHFLQMIGYTRTELEQGAIQWDTITPAEYMTADQEAIEHLKQYGFFNPWEKEYYRKDGSRVSILLGAAMMPESENQTICVVVDITQRKIAEQENQRLKERLEFVLSANPAVIFTCKPDGNYGATFITDNIYNVTGYTPEEILSDSSFWIRHIHPADVMNIMTQLPQIFEPGHHSHEYRFLCQDLSWRWLREELRLIRDAQGHPLEIVGYFADITDMKQIQAELAESEAKFRGLVEGASDVIWAIGIDSCFTYLSPQFETIFGWKPHEWLGKSFIDLIHPDDIERARHHYQKHILSGEKMNNFECQCQHQNGHYLWVRVSAASITNEEGRIIGSQGILADISDMKQAEIALQASENRFRRVFSSNIVGMMFTDFSGQIVDANDRFLDMIGYTREELNNHEINWAEMTPPEYKANDYKAIEHLTLYGTIDPWEKEYYRKDGSRVPVLIGVALLDNPEEDSSCVCVILDISDRKQAEIAITEYAHEIEDLYNNAPCGYHSLDVKGRYIRINQTELKLLGYSYNEMIGQPMSDFLTETGRQNFFKNHQLFLAQGWVQNLEYEMICKDGTILPVMVSAIAVKDDDGNYLYSRSTMVDIRDQKRAEQIIFQQADREKLLREITQKIRESLDLKTIFDTACKEIRRMILADRVGIFKFYPESNFDDGEFVAESVVDKFPSVMKIRVHDHCFGENYAKLYTQGKYYVANDIYNNGLTNCHIDVLAQFQIRANLVMPLLCGDELWGLLCIHQCGMTRYWQQSELDLIQQIAHQLAIAIQQANLYEQIQTELQVRQETERTIALQLQRQQTLAIIIQKIRESLDIHDILAKVTEQVKDVLQSDRVIVFQLFPDGKSHIVEELVSPPFPTLKNRQWLDETWSEEILNFYWQGIPRIVPDVMNDIWTDCLIEYNIEGQIQSKIVAPILLEVRNNEHHRWIAPSQINKLWGILVVHSCKEPRIWQESEAELLQQIANQLAIAIQQASLFEQLQKELMAKQLTQKQLTEINQQLALSNEQLARATRLKDEFLANMSHELRTPLNAILGMSEALQEEVFGSLNDKQHQALQTLESSGTHLLALINDILDVAKIESGKIELHRTPTSIHQLCESSLVFIKQQALQKRIQIHTEIPHYLPDLVIDERRIRQVLINLLNNAIKFTPEGGRVSLKVSIKSNPAPTETELPINYISFAITDNGIGITPDNLTKLFQPFIQIDSALNRQYAGTGLGLTLVKRIVEMHGGKVEVNSKIGVGSCFMFRIPCEDLLFQIPKTTSSPSPNLEQNEVFDQNSPHQEAKDLALILLAEDNEANIMTISRYLKAKGYKIILAKNGQEAIAQAKANHPDLILMDIQMPGMDGLEAIKILRQDSDRTIANIPIIALTALAMTGDQERCLAAGANEYLTKPVKLNQLTSTIQKILAQGKKP